MSVKHVQVGLPFPRASNLLPVRELEWAGFVYENTCDVPGLGEQIQLRYGSNDKLHVDIAAGDHTDIVEGTGSRVGNVVTNPPRVSEIWDTTIQAMEMRGTSFTEEDLKQINKAIISNIYFHTKPSDYVCEGSSLFRTQEKIDLEDLIYLTSTKKYLRHVIGNTKFKVVELPPLKPLFSTVDLSPKPANRVHFDESELHDKPHGFGKRSEAEFSEPKNLSEDAQQQEEKQKSNAKGKKAKGKAKNDETKSTQSTAGSKDVTMCSEVHEGDLGPVQCGRIGSLHSSCPLTTLG
jgi:hypothetical protein